MSHDYMCPDYAPEYEKRRERLARIRANPQYLEALKQHYANDPAAFIRDWGMLQEPRHAERGLPTVIPFLPFPRHVEWIAWALERWRNQQPGLTEKSREMGMSWLTIAFACTMCLFHRGMIIGFGSRKEEYVDQRGAPKALFEKARFFLSHLPVEFLGGWDRDRHAPHMRILFPGTGSAMTGESGDGIGRGDRASIYVVDEAAFLERPQLIDASLSATTNCRLDISTPNGFDNPFATKRHSGKISVFTLHWRSDPRKDDAWYAKQCDILDPVTLAAEVDINYSASIEGVLIPSAWIQSAIGAAERLGIKPSGFKRAGLDVADEGVDRNALAGRYGIVLETLHSWSGKGSDIYDTVARAFDICDEKGYKFLSYDGNGLGAGVRGDARIMNERRGESRRARIHDEPFLGSGAVHEPDGSMIPGRLNRDLFAHLKAQAYWALRMRFQATWRAVVKGLPFNADDLISIAPNLAELSTLVTELSRPTYSLNNAGKILVDKSPDGARSPNLADAVMIAFSPAARGLELWIKLGAAP